MTDNLPMHVMSVLVKTEEPIDVDNLTYGGYTLKRGESIWSVSDDAPENGVMYYSDEEKLHPDPNYAMHLTGSDRLLVVSVITEDPETHDREVTSRWNLTIVGGTPVSLERNYEVDVSGYDAKFQALDEKYLTARVLAGIGLGDEYALAQWEAHEAEAQILRDNLAQAQAGSEG
jgi:hypothetical protein